MQQAIVNLIHLSSAHLQVYKEHSGELFVTSKNELEKKEEGQKKCDKFCVEMTVFPFCM